METKETLNYLRSPEAVREQATYLLGLAKKNQLEHFSFHEEKIPDVVNYVEKVIKANYPTLEVPFHSRWRHFNAGGVDRNAELDKKLSGASPEDIARSKIELAIVSVLLDAGAGDKWSFKEEGTGKTASGGGVIHRDALNPWFLENTRTVRYCIDIDVDNFGVSADEASRQVTSALNEWTATLRLSDDEYYGANELVPFGQIRIGTQNFVELSCSDAAELDLRFQLGRLTAEQQANFNNPKEFVGIAVRTEYDISRLKGRGFIYLSPVSGPLAPNHQRMHPAAWSQHDFMPLKVVLKHELGHIFGMDHQQDSFMDDKWPELIVERQFLQDLTPGALEYFARKSIVSRFRVNPAKPSLALASCTRN